jgi:hypothetical protein
MTINLTNIKSDSKNTWNTINEVLHRTANKSHLPNYFKINDEFVTNPKQIADKFNDFFVNLGPNLAKNIDVKDKPTFDSYLKNKPATKFHFNTITEAITQKIMSKMKPKSSSGIDNISLKLLKLSMPHIIQPLTALINQSLTSGIFPDDLKVAKVIPIYIKSLMNTFSITSDPFHYYPPSLNFLKRWPTYNYFPTSL